MKAFFLLFIFLFFAEVLLCQNTLDNAGLTSGTPASIAFSLRKLSINYTGPAVKVRRSSDNSEGIVAFNGNGGVSAASMISFTPGATVGISLGVLQIGTISSDVSRTGLITIKTNKTGTITTTSSSVTVSGTGTSFITELIVGDRLFNAATNTFIGIIASITNNTTLLLTSYATLTVNLASYKSSIANVTGTGTNFASELAIGDRLFNLTNSYLGTVASIINATTLTLNSIDATSVTTANYKGTTTVISGSGTNFNSLSLGDMLISNNITLGIIASIATSTSLTLATKSSGAVSAQGSNLVRTAIAESYIFSSTALIACFCCSFSSALVTGFSLSCFTNPPWGKK